MKKAFIEEDRRVNGPSSRKVQRYRKAWESEPEFEDWLRPHQSKYKANCKFCCKTIIADLSVITAHAISKRHSYIQEEYNKVKKKLKKEPQGSSSGSMSQKPVKMVAPDKISNNLNQQRNDDDPLILVGQTAPNWKSTGVVDGQMVNLDFNEYIVSHQYVIMFFYEQDFCKVSASEITALNGKMRDLAMLDAAAICCSTDSHYAHLAWTKTSPSGNGIGKVLVPLLADPTHSISKKFGVYSSTNGHAMRAHFIIDNNRIVRHVMVNDNAIGRSINEIVRTVAALSFAHQNHESTCADWAPKLEITEIDGESYIITNEEETAS